MLLWHSNLGSVSEMCTHAHFDYCNHSSLTSPMTLAIIQALQTLDRYLQWILHVRVLCMSRYVIQGCKSCISHCEDGRSLSAPKTVVLNRLCLLPRVLNSLSWRYTLCVAYIRAYSGQLKWDQITKSLVWACGLELLRNDCPQLSSFMFFCTFVLSTASFWYCVVTVKLLNV